MTDLNEHAQAIQEQLPADVDVPLEDLIDQLEILVNEYQVPIQEAQRNIITEYRPGTAEEEVDPVAEHEADVSVLKQKLAQFKTDLRGHYTIHFDELNTDRCYVVVSDIRKSGEEVDLYALGYNLDPERYITLAVGTDADGEDIAGDSEASVFETYDAAVEHLQKSVPPEKRYYSEGTSQSGDVSIYVADGRTTTELDTRQDVASYSDDFAWGSADDQATDQLAIAILADYYDDETALTYSEDFAQLFVTRWDADETFSITGSRIENYLDIFANPTAESVVVSGLPDNEKITPYTEPTRYRAVDFVAVNAERLHVWYDGRHYLGAGTATEVEEGDVFYFPRGFSHTLDEPPLVTTVEELSESQADSAEYPDAYLDVGERINVGFLIGAPMNMAQLPPPELLVPE